MNHEEELLRGLWVPAMVHAHTSAISTLEPIAHVVEAMPKPGKKSRPSRHAASLCDGLGKPVQPLTWHGTVHKAW